MTRVQQAPAHATSSSVRMTAPRLGGLANQARDELLGIEIGAEGGLIEQEQARRAEQRAGEGEAAAHGRVEPGDDLPRVIAESDEGQRLSRAIGRQAAELAVEGEIAPWRSGARRGGRPRRGRRSARACSADRGDRVHRRAITLPPLASSSPARIWSSRVLPQAGGPMTATISPAATSSEGMERALRPSMSFST